MWGADEKSNLDSPKIQRRRLRCVRDSRPTRHRTTPRGAGARPRDRRRPDTRPSPDPSPTSHRVHRRDGARQEADADLPLRQVRAHVIPGRWPRTEAWDGHRREALSRHPARRRARRRGRPRRRGPLEVPRPGHTPVRARPDPTQVRTPHHHHRGLPDVERRQHDEDGGGDAGRAQGGERRDAPRQRRAGHPVRLLPGWMQDGMHVLRHGHARRTWQPHVGRDLGTARSRQQALQRQWQRRRLPR